MTDFHPYRPRNPSPWPRRLALAVLIAAVALAWARSARCSRRPHR